MSGRDISFSTSTDAADPLSRRQPHLGRRRRDRPAPKPTRSSATFGPASSATTRRLARAALAPARAEVDRGAHAVWSSHLDGLRESRKAVIAVTLGWRLFRENETRMTDEGHERTRRRRGAARRRPGRQAGLSGSKPRRRVERQDLRRRPHAGLDRQQPAAVPGSDRRGEPGEHQLLHRRCRRPAHRRRARTRPPRSTRWSRPATASACRIRPTSIRSARSVSRPTAWPSSTPTTSARACARPPPTSTPTTCSATRRPTARPTASTARSGSR